MDMMSGARTRAEPQPEVPPDVTAKMKRTRATGRGMWSASNVIAKEAQGEITCQDSNS